MPPVPRTFGRLRGRHCAPAGISERLSMDRTTLTSPGPPSRASCGRPARPEGRLTKSRSVHRMKARLSTGTSRCRCREARWVTCRSESGHSRRNQGGSGIRQRPLPPSPPRPGPGSPGRSARRPPPRPVPGAPSARTRTCWWSRPPARARRWPPSSPLSTGSPTPRRRPRPAAAVECSTSPRSRRSLSTWNAICAARSPVCATRRHGSGSRSRRSASPSARATRPPPSGAPSPPGRRTSSSPRRNRCS